MKANLKKLFTVALAAGLLASCSGFKDLKKDWDAPLTPIPEPQVKADGSALNSQNIDFGKKYSTYLNPDNDPYQQFNRYAFAINYHLLDRYFLKPLAILNKYIISPELASALVTLKGTLDEPATLINNLATFQTQEAGKNTARLAINIFFGMGMIDWASEMGIYSNGNDLNYTLAKYGVKPGPYLMIPGLGPTYTRQLVFKTLIQDNLQSLALGTLLPWSWTTSVLNAYNIINLRTALMGQEGMIANAFDRYEVVKSLYAQNATFAQSKATGEAPPVAEAPAFSEDLLNNF